MADQVVPIGGLPSGLPSAILVAAAPKPLADKPRPAKAADSQAGREAARSVPGSAKATEADVEALNSHLQQAETGLKFQVDEATGRTVFRIVDATSGEVVIQVPSEEVLAMARNLRALDEQMGTSGVLIDKEG
jgi:flagellar protein FlaG